MLQFIGGLDNVRFEVTLKTTDNSGGVIVCGSSLDRMNGSVALYSNTSNTTYLAQFPWVNVKSSSRIKNNDGYYKYRLDVSGNNVSATLFDSNGTSKFSGSTSKSLSSHYFSAFVISGNILIKEISVQEL